MRKRTDDNQKEIIAVLKKTGCSVMDTSAVGKGFPDLVVGLAGKNYLLEVKNSNRPPCKRKLTTSQVEFHRDWRGTIHKVETIEDALQVIYVIYGRQA